MQYILFVHNNNPVPTTSEQWQAFFNAAGKSGLFKGGSAINQGVTFGTEPTQVVSAAVVGYMLFEADDVTKVQRLLQLHPVVMQGGTVELCEAPKT